MLSDDDSREKYNRLDSLTAEALSRVCVCVRDGCMHVYIGGIRPPISSCMYDLEITPTVERERDCDKTCSYTPR